MSLAGVTGGCSGCPCTPAEPAVGHRSQPAQLRAPWSGSLGRPVQEKRVNKGLDWAFVIHQISRGSDGASPLPEHLLPLLHTGSLWLTAGRGTWGRLGVTSDLLVTLLWDEDGGGTPKGQPLTIQGPLQDEVLRGLRVRVTLLSLPKVGGLRGAGRDGQTSCPTPALPAGCRLGALTGFAARAPFQAPAPGAFSCREK